MSKPNHLKSIDIDNMTVVWGNTEISIRVNDSGEVEVYSMGSWALAKVVIVKAYEDAMADKILLEG